MAIKAIDDAILQGIAEAIQEKDGGGKMHDTEMRGRIENLPSGGGTLISKTITQNGVYNASSDNADGYDVVMIDVPERNTLNECLMGTIKHISSEFAGTFKLKCTDFQNLETVYLPNIKGMSVDYSGLYFFSNCPNLKQVNISGVTSINNFTFHNDIALEEVIMPNVTSIGVDAFYNCRALSITKLPNGVNSIGTSAFGQCSGIVYLDFSDFDHIPTLGADTFVNTTFPFYFRDQQQIDEWAAATNWSVYADRFQIKPSEVI